MIIEIFVHWKGLIVAAIIGAVLLGGYSYYKSMKNVNSDMKSGDAVMSEIESSMTEDEISTLNKNILKTDAVVLFEKLGVVKRYELIRELMACEEKDAKVIINMMALSLIQLKTLLMKIVIIILIHKKAEQLL